VQAQVAMDHAPRLSQVSDEDWSESYVDTVDDESDISRSPNKGSKIIAGTELLANTTVGFGFFGQKAERPDHARSISRDYSIPKSRKAAFGVALRF